MDTSSSSPNKHMQGKHTAIQHVRTRRLASICVAAAVFCALSISMSAWAVSVTDPDIYWYLDDPSAKEYTMETASDIRGLAELVNGTAVDENGNAISAVDFSGVTIYQTGDFTLSLPGVSSAFTPIGTSAHPFNGTYDGQGHTVRGFSLSGVADIGFFGVTGKDSTIKNLDVTTSSLYPTSIEISTAKDVIKNVGTVVGCSYGTVENCSSSAPVTITSTTAATEKEPSVVSNVGGVCGYALSDMSGCSYTGAITVKVSTDAATEDLYTADSIGGVVGRFGEWNQHGTLSGSYNIADIWVVTLGAGDSDRFGITTYARSTFVGGVCGYANGSIVNCHNGSYDTYYGQGSGTVQTSATEAVNGEPISGQGGEEVGGVCGSVRGESDRPGRYNDGDPDDPTVIKNCYNLGSVTGCTAVGGIVGEMGAYCSITQCYNGTTEDEDIATVTSTRWNKPCTGGILGQGRGASVNYCANYAMVQNVQTGYYTAGIVGALYIGDDYPDLQPEVYACFNSGHIYTSNRTSGSGDYREAGLVGTNEGYVHDSVMLYGTVPYHDDSPIGDNDWGKTSNLYVLKSSEMQTSYCASLLNACTGGSWDVYWYMNGSGYPVLNVWEDPTEVTVLSADIIERVEIEKQAAYLGEGIDPVPTLAVYLRSGKRMYQDTDFYVIPEDGAWDVTSGDEAPYSATIVGLGCYTGRVANVVKYGIGQGDLSSASVLISNGIYTLGKAVFPDKVQVVASGVELDQDSYSYRIYDYNTADETSTTKYVVFDSEGYVSFDGGTTLAPVTGKTLEGSFILYDRNRAKISDSNATVYDPQTGLAVSGTTSCAYYKSGSPAGNLVEVTANSSAVKFSGTTYGRYVVSAASLMNDVLVDSIIVGDEHWYWDSDESCMYMRDANGNRVAGNPSTVFTGSQIKPAFTLSYLGQNLVESEDIAVYYGDPNGGSSTDNISVTSEETGEYAGVIIRSADAKRFSSYLTAFFDITPAALEDCEIYLDSDEYSYTGSAVEPEVHVVLNGISLEKDRDYTVSYSNNLRTTDNATYTVTAKDNLSGGAEKTFTGTFKIGDGENIAGYTMTLSSDPIYYNFGDDPKVSFTLTDKSGKQVTLQEGTDYTLSFSQNTIGNATLTLQGAGKYSGSIVHDIVIVPYDVEKNPYDQVKIAYQELTFGTWVGEYNSTDAKYQIGSNCPVQSVEFYPVTDWNTMTFGDPYTVKTTQTIVGTVEAYYYNASGAEVTYKTAVPGTLTSKVVFTRYTDSSGVQTGCSGTITKEVMYASGADIATAVEWSTEGAQTYTGEEIKPVVGTTKSGIRLEEGTDYTIAYSNNINAGVASYTVTAKAGSYYAGTYSGTFSIVALNLDGNATVGPLADEPYTGSAVEPHPVVHVSGKVLTEGADYTLSYANNTSPGLATVYISGRGNYTGTIQATFVITNTESGKTLEGGTITGVAESYPYTGSPITPEITVIDKDGTVLQENVDYLVGYANNIDVGTAVITITGIGNYTGTLTATFAITKADITYDELSGNIRYDTMEKIVKAAYAGKTSEYAILATGENFPDALAAATLAGVLDAPVVMASDADTTQAIEALQALSVRKIYVVGGTSALSSSCVQTVLDATGTSLAGRLSGNTRQQTAIRIAEKAQEISGEASSVAIIATGKNFADALSVSPYAYATNTPIYLTLDDGTLDNETVSAIHNAGCRDYIFVGGKDVVSDSVKDQLGTTDTHVNRLSGDIRYDTAAAIAAFSAEAHVGLTYASIAVATGENFPDALAGAAWCGQTGSVMVLANESADKVFALLRANKNSVLDVTFLGGKSVVTDATRTLVKEALE